MIRQVQSPVPRCRIAATQRKVNRHDDCAGCQYYKVCPEYVRAYELPESFLEDCRVQSYKTDYGQYHEQYYDQFGSGIVIEGYAGIPYAESACAAG